MTLKLEVMVTGPLNNNVSILYDDATNKSLVFDPSFGPEALLDFIQQHGLIVESILLTHGHFDHFAGVRWLESKLPQRPALGMHRNDLELMRKGGASKNFYMPVPPPDDPDFFVEDGQVLHLGTYPIEVRLAPGHTAGSVIFFIEDLDCAVCGDVIFYHGIGRTDFEGGDYDTLIMSIERQVFTLSPETRLIPGHGEETTVREEITYSPFFNPPD